MSINFPKAGNPGQQTKVISSEEKYSEKNSIHT
jgi:hypothetical protein